MHTIFQRYFFIFVFPYSTLISFLYIIFFVGRTVKKYITTVLVARQMMIAVIFCINQQLLNIFIRFDSLSYPYHQRTLKRKPIEICNGAFLFFSIICRPIIFNRLYSIDTLQRRMSNFMKKPEFSNNKKKYITTKRIDGRFSF